MFNCIFLKILLFYESVEKSGAGQATDGNMTSALHAV
jgi:hypothetical protein